MKSHGNICVNSRFAAHVVIIITTLYNTLNAYSFYTLNEQAGFYLNNLVRNLKTDVFVRRLLSNELRHDKTCLWGF